MELTELVHKGEKRGMFTDKMPAVIQQDVRDENLRFMKNRDVFNQEYFRFVRLLVSRNSVSFQLYIMNYTLYIFVYTLIN